MCKHNYDTWHKQCQPPDPRPILAQKNCMQISTVEFIHVLYYGVFFCYMYYESLVFFTLFSSCRSCLTWLPVVKHLYIHMGQYQLLSVLSARLSPLNIDHSHNLPVEIYGINYTESIKPLMTNSLLSCHCFISYQKKFNVLSL